MKNQVIKYGVPVALAATGALLALWAANNVAPVKKLVGSKTA